MAYKVPALEEMLQFLVALFKGLLPDRNIGSRFTFHWKLLKVIADAVTDVHANVASAFKDVMPDTARGAALDRQLGIYAPGGLKTRKAATPARKAAAGRVRGTLGATTAVGDQLIHRASGLLFQVNSNATIPAALFVDVDILAISTGSKTRLLKGQVLEYTATPPGIQLKVELQRDLDDDGFDGEQDGSAHNRLLAALSTPSSGGSQADFVGWALAQLGIEALSGADSVILQTAPTNNPAATDIVYAGGPLTDVVRAAIVAHLNGDVLYAAPTGPLPGAVAATTSTSVVQLQVLATGIGTANPGGIYGAWVGALLRGTLAKIATYTRGVRSSSVISPAADQEAVDYAFPLDGQIGLLIPGYVLVRRG